MTSNNFRAAYNAIINESVTPVLNAAGFKKSGSNYYRRTGELVQIFNLQTSGLNSDYAVFTFNMGLISPEIYQEVYKEPLPKAPQEIFSIVRTRLPYLVLNADKWYALKAGVDPQKLSKQIEDELKKYGLPWFEAYTTVASLLKALKGSVHGGGGSGTIDLFMLYLKTGNAKKAADHLNKAYSMLQADAHSQIKEIESWAEKYKIKLRTSPKVVRKETSEEYAWMRKNREKLARERK